MSSEHQADAHEASMRILRRAACWSVILKTAADHWETTVSPSDQVGRGLSQLSLAFAQCCERMHDDLEAGLPAAGTPAHAAELCDAVFGIGAYGTQETRS